MDYKNLLLNVNQNIGLITINRPDKLNALNRETLTELKMVLEKLRSDENIFVVIITGSGEKAFIAGADISEINKLNMLEGKKFAEFGQSVFSLIEKFEKPVIAAVNGFALGGGCELALSCHIRYAGENAKFGQPEVNLGIIPGYGGTQRLTRLINSGRAAEMILTGDMIDANEALRIGLVNKVYPQSELQSSVFDIAVKIASKGQQAIRLALKAIKAVDEVTLQEGQNLEAALFALCCGTEDFKEGTKAFLEKRKPVFLNK
ncbi:MAG: enoyl-CoA hydratase-related protein [Ignavibacterium sp.]|jgi:enoyl-CoA hydratase|nr:enoyl-CoA hydratase-related protein [Ignavibacterium sp.]MDX9712271.1 enoyl-CoA hydratase-related protein [Ignavibacteriaceae bacterium]GIK22331.1 MAG: crotonase [Ignavibacteriota bacterium]